MATSGSVKNYVIVGPRASSDCSPSDCSPSGGGDDGGGGECRGGGDGGGGGGSGGGGDVLAPNPILAFLDTLLGIH